jgi:hypothetical protein
MAALQKGARITGRDREKLATELQKAYAKGASIRELAHGRSCTARSPNPAHRYADVVVQPVARRKARQSKARQGKARQGKARQGR